jgi:integrase
MDKFTLVKYVGHKSPRTTERYYIHVTEPHTAADFERFLQYHNARIIEPFAAEKRRVH